MKHLSSIHKALDSANRKGKTHTGYKYFNFSMTVFIHIFITFKSVCSHTHLWGQKKTSRSQFPPSTIVS